MAQLVPDLLNLSRIAKQRPEPPGNDVQSESFDEAIQPVKPEIEDRDIEWRSANCRLIACDPGFVRQVFANLLSNAVKYTEPRKGD